MMNKVMLLGRLAKDPEVRTTNNSKSVASFTLAVSRKVAKNAPANTPKADFFPVIAWEGLANIVASFCKKGKQVIVTGKLQTRNWTDDKGTKHYVTEILAEDVIFVDSKSEGGQAQPASVTADTTQGFYPIPDDDELPF